MPGVKPFLELEKDQRQGSASGRRAIRFLGAADG